MGPSQASGAAEAGRGPIGRRRWAAALLCVGGAIGPPVAPASAGPRAVAEDRPAEDIRFWYGEDQAFGSRGRPQRWVNVLGDVGRPDELAGLRYRLNGGPPKNLATGSDRHRLALPGDFNVELPWDDLDLGENRLTVIRTDRSGATASRDVTVRVDRPRDWPLPYVVDFSKVRDLQSVVQVVDGRWALTGEGVRTIDPYYDRVLAVGDVATWKDYEAVVRLTIHGFTPPSPGPPTYGVTHFGLALRWRGHTPDGLQPSRQWHPLGAQGEFLLLDDGDRARWRILYDGGPDRTAPSHSGRANAVVLGEELFVKGGVYTDADGTTRYRFKQWMVGTPEPLGWDVEGREDGARDFDSGALCLVPHNADVTIHELRVEPLVAPPGEPRARQGPGNLHASAPVGGHFGARGTTFREAFLGPGDWLDAIRVNHRGILRGIRFRVVDPGGIARIVTLGLEEGDWRDWYAVPEGASLAGISGASGWYLDGIRFHLDDGASSPLYYDHKGGDTTFRLVLNDLAPLTGSAVRGFYGAFDEHGIEYLGLLFHPHD